MYGYKISLAGEIPAISDATGENTDSLEKIGREVVELLRHHGFMVDTATLACAGAHVDLVVGTIKPAPTAVSEDVTKNERKLGKARRNSDVE